MVFSVLFSFVVNLDDADFDWKHAKWIWRSSLATLVTVGPHLTQTHWLVTNSCHIAWRTKLESEHPIR